MLTGELTSKIGMAIEEARVLPMPRSVLGFGSPIRLTLGPYPGVVSALVRICMSYNEGRDGRTLTGGKDIFRLGLEG